MVSEIVSTEGHRIDECAVPCISYPIDLLIGWAIDIGIQHAKTNGVSANFPDFVQGLIRAVETASRFDRIGRHPVRNLPDFKRMREVAECKRSVAETAPLMRREYLMTFTADVAETIACIAGPEDAAVVDPLKEIGVDNRALRCINFNLYIANRFTPEVNHEMHLTVRLRMDRRPVAVVMEQCVRLNN